MKATIVFAEDHHTRCVEGFEAVEAVLHSGRRHFWLDIEGPDEESVRWLDSRFHFHPLALEDLLLPNYRPKLSAYEDHLFLIAHAVAMEDGKLDAAEVHSFLLRDCLVTVHDLPSAVVERVRQAVIGEGNALVRGADYVLYLLLDELADSFFFVVDRVDDVLDDLEVAVLQRVEPGLLDRVFELRRALVTLRRLSNHQRDAINNLAAHEGAYVRRANALYLRDVQTLMVTIHEIIDSQRDLTNGVLEVYLSAASNRLGDIMKRLTLVATIFLPISFIAGVFGTNFSFMPFDNPAWFVFFLLSLATTTAAMLAWFRRQGWL